MGCNTGRAVELRRTLSTVFRTLQTGIGRFLLILTRRALSITVLDRFIINVQIKGIQTFKALTLITRIAVLGSTLRTFSISIVVFPGTTTVHALIGGSQIKSVNACDAGLQAGAIKARALTILAQIILFIGIFWALVITTSPIKKESVLTFLASLFCAC